MLNIFYSIDLTQLREYSLELREIYSAQMRTLSVQPSLANKSRDDLATLALQACRSRKVSQMSEIYTILAMTVGVPPKADTKLTYEFYDKNKKFQTIKATPLEIYKSLENHFKAQDNISLINDPRNETGKLYTVQRLGNVWGARPVLYVNTETETLEKTVVKMLKADIPVWYVAFTKVLPCGLLESLVDGGLTFAGSVVMLANSQIPLLASWTRSFSNMKRHLVQV